MTARPSRPALAAVLALPLALAATGAVAASEAGVHLHADLSGANEVGPNGQTGVGAPGGTGTFSASLNAEQGRLCYTLTWSGIGTPAAAHIHTGPAGANGGVFVPLATAAGEQCVTIDGEKATALVAKPDNYYVNIHTPAFPAGAVRGQIMKH